MHCLVAHALEGCTVARTETRLIHRYCAVSWTHRVRVLCSGRCCIRTDRYNNGAMPTSKGFTGQHADATMGLSKHKARLALGAMRALVAPAIVTAFVSPICLVRSRACAAFQHDQDKAV